VNVRNAEDYGKVAVLMGGDSHEREVSLRSGTAIYEALLSKGIDAHTFDPAKQPISELSTKHFDRAFIALHGKHGEDGVIQGALEMMSIPYSGSGILASAIGMDKVRSKLIWQALDLPVIPGVAVEPETNFKVPDAEKIILHLGKNLMVKPSSEGSSIGMTVCHDAEQLVTAVETAREFSERVLVETLLSGPEYTVTILQDQYFPSIRIEPKREFYDYEAKYSDAGTEYFCPSGLDEELEKHLGEVSLKAFKAIGCIGWGRVDFMHDAVSDKYLLIEINTVPGMTETSLVPKSALSKGISFADLVMTILDSSFIAQGLKA